MIEAQGSVPTKKKGRSNSAELCSTSQLATCKCSTKEQATSLFIGVPQWLQMVLESFWGGKKEPSEKTGFINSADHRNICSTCCPFSSDALTSGSLVCSCCTRCILSYLIFPLSISGQYLAFCIPWAYLDFMASVICDFSSRVNKIHGLATCLFLHLLEWMDQEHKLGAQVSFSSCQRHQRGYIKG